MTIPPEDISAEITSLIDALARTEARLEELTLGEIDTVSDREGRTFLLRRAQDQARMREASNQAAILNALPAHIALLNQQGVITAVNGAWEQFASDNGCPDTGCGMGLNYLDVCDRAVGFSARESRAVSEGIRSVLAGGPEFSIEYPCHSPTENRWFLLTVSSVAGAVASGAIAMHLNVTARKVADMALQELSEQTARNERLLNSALSSMSDFAQVYDRAGRLLFVNQPLLDLWGLRLDEIIGKNFFDLGYPPELAERLLRQLNTVFETKQRIVDETRYPNPLGLGGIYEYIFSPVLTADGTVEFVVGSTRDVTERKRVESELRESETSMAIAQRIAHFGNWEVDLTGRKDVDANTLRWSDEMFRIAGFEPGAVEVDNELFFGLVPLDDHDLIRDAIATAIRERTGYSVHHRLIRSDGETRFVQDEGLIVFDEETGQPLKIVGTAHDVTEQHKLSRELEIERERLLEAQSVAKIGSWETDLSTFEVVWSDEAHRIFGTDPSTFHPTHSDFLRLVHPEDRAGVDEAFRESLTSRLSSAIQHRVLLLDGTIKFVEERWLVSFDEQGKPERVLGTCQDITERKLADNEIDAALKRLNEAQRIGQIGDWEMDVTTNAATWSPQIFEIFGRDPSLGPPRDQNEFALLFDPESRPRVAAQVAALVKSDDAPAEELKGTRPNGDPFYVLAKVKVRRDRIGQLTGFYGTIQDITERKQAELLLAKSQQSLLLATGSVHLGIWDWDVQADKLEWDARMFELYGIREQDFGCDYDGWLAWIHPDDRDRADVAIQAALDEAKDISIEFRVVWPNGEVHHIEAHGLVLRADDGTPIRMTGVNRDITERKCSQEALRESEERFRFLNDLAEATRALVEPSLIIDVTSRMLGEYLKVSRCAYADVAEDGDRFTILHDYTDGCASSVGEYHLSQFGSRAISTLQSGKTIVFRDIDSDLSAADGAESFNAVGIKAIICCPLLKNGALRTLIAVHHASARDWSQAEVNLVQEVVDRCWSSIQRLYSEEKLRQSEMEFRTLAEAMPQMVWVARPDGWSSYLSQQWMDYSGLTMEESLGSGWIEAFHPEDKQRTLEAWQAATSTGNIYSIECRLRRSDGIYHWWLVRGVPVKDSSNNILKWFGTCTDINDLKLAELEVIRTSESLRRQQTELRVLFDLMPALIWFKDTNDTILRINQRAADSVGMPVEEIEGKSTFEIYPDQAAKYSSDDQEVILSGRPKLDIVEKLTELDGKELWVQTDKVPVSDKNGDVVGIVVMAQDITERLQNEEALKESEERFREMLENVELLAIMLDQDGKVIFCNDYMLRVTGYSRDEVVGTDWFTRFTPELEQNERKSLFKDLQQNTIATHFESQVLTKAGEIREVAWNITMLRDGSGQVVGMAGIGEDMTARKDLQEQLLQSQKMESLGLLAGGIAHDFNNLLTGMLGYAELAQLQLPKDSPVQSDLEEVVQSAQRAATLTKQLLSFARKEVVEPQVVSLSDSLVGLHSLLHRLLGPSIKLEVLSSPDLGRVKLDPSQFEQVLVNLCINARDAMPRGGELTITLSNTTAESVQESQHGVLLPGRYVMVSVGDTGIGMTKEVQSRIFDPFFTTKDKSKGTGLGLSTCYGIVTNSGGQIWANSELNVGTTFELYFPRVDEPLTPRPLDTDSNVAGTGETVLVVEDEDTVRSLSATVLRAAGYLVMHAPDGNAALKLMAEYKSKIDILVTDVIMPGMTGPELAKVIEPMRPEMKILFMSGFTDDAIPQDGTSATSVHFLQKPFSPAQLSRKVREVLDHGALST